MIKKIMQIAKENPNGFTVYTKDLQHVKKGWVVAIKETQNCFGVEGLEKVLNMNTDCIGGWLNDKDFYFDAVLIFDNENEATRSGVENEQIAIFNIEQVKLKFL